MNFPEVACEISELGSRVRTPAVDMCEGDQAFTLTAELPGFSKDDVQVELKDNRLTLKGERKRETDVQEKQYRRRGAGLRRV